MFGFYNNNNNNNNLKIKVECLINHNMKLNSEIKQLNRSVKKLKYFYINNIKTIETINNNIDVLKEDINTIKLKNDYYTNNTGNNIDVLKEDIDTIKLKNDYYTDNIETINNNIEVLKEDINIIKLKNDYYTKNIKAVIDVLKNDINTIKLKNNDNDNDINNDDFIQI
jgi:hypothetical protein